LRIKDQIKILHIASGDLWAGAEVMIFNLVRAQQESRLTRPYVILLNDGRLASCLRDIEITVYIVSERGSSSLSIARSLHNRIRALAPDIVHTHRRKENILGGIAAYLAGRVQSMRTVHGATEWNISLARPRDFLIRALDYLVAVALQRKVVCVSSDLKDRISRYIPKAKVSLVENGIYPVVLRNQYSDQRCKRGSNQVVTLGFVGRLTRIKRPDLFVTTAAHLNKQYPGQFRFFLFGDGPLSNVTKDLVKQNGLQHKFKFFGHIADLPERLITIDLLVNTSDHEGTPISILEAMSLRIPVLARDVGGLPALLGHGKFGDVVVDASPESISYAIRQRTMNRDTLLLNVDSAYENFIDNYSAFACSEKYYQIYNSLLRH